MFIQSHAEMASEQEKALSVNTGNAKSQLESLRNLVGETGESIAELRQSIVGDTLVHFLPSFLTVTSCFSSRQL
jgi:hypothetical protein